jgi:hypothetical protein
MKCISRSPWYHTRWRHKICKKPAVKAKESSQAGNTEKGLWSSGQRHARAESNYQILAQAPRMGRRSETAVQYAYQVWINFAFICTRTSDTALRKISSGLYQEAMSAEGSIRDVLWLYYYHYYVLYILGFPRVLGEIIIINITNIILVVTCDKFKGNIFSFRLTSCYSSIMVF